MYKIHKLRFSIKALLLLKLLILAGCAAIQTISPFPQTEDKISVKVVPIYGPRVPANTYNVPNSSFVVKKRKECSKIGIFEGGGIIGLIATMIEHSSDKSEGKAIATPIEDLLRFDLAQEVNRAISSEMARGHSSPSLTYGDVNINNPTIELRPYVLLTSDDRNNVRMYCFLNAQMFDKIGSEVWCRQYIYYIPQENLITSEGSWSDENCQIFKTAVKEGFSKTVKVFLTDTFGTASGWGNKPAMLQVRLPYSNHVWTHDGVVLKQIDDMVIFSPKLYPNNVHYGIHIAPKNEVRIFENPH